MSILLKLINKIIPQKNKWRGSQHYWNQRYKNGGNSGAGSYNKLAFFKAEIINEFVKKNNIHSVIEWGCGDGNQLSLANYPAYIGYDVSPTAIYFCKRKFKNDRTKQFFCCSNFFFRNKNHADLSLSLDVLYHLIEDNIFDRYMGQLFSSSKKFVIIYSCNDNNSINNATHVKHRKFTDWIDKNAPKWELKEIIPNKYPYNHNDPENTTWSDFYIYEYKE